MRLTSAEVAQVVVALSDRMIYLRESEALLLKKLEVLNAIDAGHIEVHTTTREIRRDEVNDALRFTREQQGAVAAVQRKLDHYLLTNI